MATQYKFNTSAASTYKTAANAEKAFMSKYESTEFTVRFMIVQLDAHNCNDEKNFGRFIPVGLGQSCLDHGVHFNFHVLA